MPEWLLPWVTPGSFVFGIGVWWGIRSAVPAVVTRAERRATRVRPARRRRFRLRRLTPVEEQTLYLQRRLEEKQRWRREAADRWLAEWGEAAGWPAGLQPELRRGVVIVDPNLRKLQEAVVAGEVAVAKASKKRAQAVFEAAVRRDWIEGA